MSPLKILLEFCDNPFNSIEKNVTRISQSKILSLPFRVIWACMSAPFKIVERLSLGFLIVLAWLGWIAMANYLVGPASLGYVGAWLLVGWCFLTLDILYDNFLIPKRQAARVVIPAVDYEQDSHVVKMKR